MWCARAQLELATVCYLGWFNNHRLHEALGDLPPAEFEQLHTVPAAAGASRNSPYGLAALSAGAAPTTLP